MGAAVEGFRAHNFELDMGWIDLDWAYVDLALTRDVPKAAVYLHCYQLKIARKHIDGFMELHEIYEAFEAHETYVPPPYFPGFTQFTPEIREQIIHEYLLV
jgi:hypothetical protein